MKIFCDVETTGLNYSGGYLSHCPIVLAFIITSDNLEKIDSFVINSRHLSREKWSYESQDIHGISEHEALGFQSPLDSCKYLLERLDFNSVTCNNSLWVEHSLKQGDRMGFDLQFTLGMFVKQDMQFDFYKYININNSESTVMLGKKAGYKKNSLDLWSERISIKLNHHNAESDVNLCYETYKYLRSRNDQTGDFTLTRS